MTDENNQVEDLYIDSRDKDAVISLPEIPQNMRIKSTGKEDAKIQDCFGRHITTIKTGEWVTLTPKSQNWLQRLIRKIFRQSEWDVNKQV